MGGVASPLPAIRHRTGNEDVAPHLWLNSCANCKFQETINVTLVGMGIRNSKTSLHAAISLKTAAYPLKISIAANRDCPHRIQVPDSADTYRLPATWAADEANLEIRIS